MREERIRGSGGFFVKLSKDHRHETLAGVTGTLFFANTTEQRNLPIVVG